MAVLLSNYISKQIFVIHWSVKRILVSIINRQHYKVLLVLLQPTRQLNFSCYGEDWIMLCIDWVYTVCEHVFPISFWWFLKYELWLFKMFFSLRGCRHNIIDVHVWITECGTCLVMLKHSSYTSSVSFCRQPKKQDVNAWRNACSASQIWAPGLGTRGKRAVVFQTIPFFFFSCFPFRLSSSWQWVHNYSQA